MVVDVVSVGRGNFTAGLLFSHSGRKCWRFAAKIEMVSVVEQSVEQTILYSEKALYNQLSFYRYIFDWEYATTKILQGDEKNKFKKHFPEERDVYKKLKAVVDHVLASSSYSEVNLAKLFQAFTSLK
ncbi:DNA polymerase alpha catalytic subunit [Bagarius yarrelli]|uniref:DNA polymerase alpha catalytic subunit n=1 Tax=Bagarius yarrelli TaxID=175774 RepID=A0A556TWQ8_BAGYA|nr:DNA polymerase alpha catalytic subunit [Bagarius yarrelli]